MSKKPFIIVALIWIGIVGLSLLYVCKDIRDTSYKMARKEADSSFNKDLVYRRWAAVQGGVYVPPSAETPSNPFLSHVANRDVTTTDGKKLTLINPAYMTRQVHEIAKQQYGVQGHITSLNPLRPENKADEWETKALNFFGSGGKEYSSIEMIKGEPYLRFMKPMVTEPSCLKCHAAQGYKAGDIRGGISVSVPFTPYLEEQKTEQAKLSLIHGVISLLGLFGIWFFNRSEFRSYTLLRESQERLNLAVESTNLGPWDWDLHTNEVFFSPEWKRQIGYEDQEIPGQYEEWEKRLHPDDRQRALDTLQAYLDDRTSVYDLEFRLRHKDGSYRWIYTRGRKLLDKNAQAYRMVGCHVDVTERKLAEESLRQTNERLRLITDNLPNGMTYQLDMGTSGEIRQFCYVSAGVEKLHGVSGEAAMQDANLLYQQYLEPERSLIAEEEVRALATMTPFKVEARYQTESGDIHWSLLASSPHRDANGHLLWDGVEIDITDIKRTQEIINKAAIEWSAAMDASNDAVYLLDTTRHLLRANKVFYEMTGTTPETATGKHIVSIIHPEGEKSPCPVCRAQDELRDEVMQMEVDHPNNPTGKPIEITATVVRDINKQPISILMRLHDLTEQRKVEHALRYSKEEWERTFDALSDIATIQDRDMRIIRANRAACDAFQVEPMSIVGKYCYEVFRGSMEPCPNCPEALTLQSGENHSGVITHQNLGKIFHVSSSPVLDETGNFTRLIHIAKDITNQQKMEAELFQAHKMEAIGTLAGGIAHDFNNILAAILGYTELAIGATPEWHQTKEYLDQVLKAANRARELVKQILTFGRKGQESHQPVQPFLIIKEGLKLMRASLPTTIQIDEEIDTESGFIIANPTGIHQILVNLCTNAFHAMANETGVLTVKLSTVELDKHEVSLGTGVSAGRFVELVVSDTGGGIDQKTMCRIFEPYFTTKEVGKGSGMGLALVHGIVQSYGGFVRVESTLGEGSTFHVYFPSAVMRHEPSKKDEQGVKLSGGTERILVVDDEKSIADMHEATLTRLGYRVTAFDDSSEALEAFMANPNNFDMVITDQTMPKIPGSELSKQILQCRPDIPIILCTGYSTMISEEKAQKIKVKRFLMKPVSTKDLANTVREELDKKTLANDSNDTSTKG